MISAAQRMIGLELITLTSFARSYLNCSNVELELIFSSQNEFYY